MCSSVDVYGFSDDGHGKEYFEYSIMADGSHKPKSAEVVAGQAYGAPLGRAPPVD
jgi:hypothetical protein